MTTKKKILLLPAILAVLAVGVATLPALSASAATIKTRPIKAVGMAKFVLKGTVIAVSADTLTLNVSNTSKNARLFDNKHKTLTISAKTVITKSGKKILLNQINAGNKVKVFGIFDKKTGDIILVRWVKVLPK